MIYSLLVLAAPEQGQGCRTAALFAQGLLQRGHRLHRVFFLDEGTASGNAHRVLPQDETDPLQDWLELAREYEVELILCVSSALRRGVLDETEATRYQRANATAHPAFTVSGLGQLVDACAESDRLVTFGG